MNEEVAARMAAFGLKTTQQQQQQLPFLLLTWVRITGIEEQKAAARDRCES
jgi:hypothetical protein